MVVMTRANTSSEHCCRRATQNSATFPAQLSPAFTRACSWLRVESSWPVAPVINATLRTINPFSLGRLGVLFLNIEDSNLAMECVPTHTKGHIDDSSRNHAVKKTAGDVLVERMSRVVRRRRWFGAACRPATVEESAVGPSRGPRHQYRDSLIMQSM